MKPLWELTLVARPDGTDVLELKVGGSSIELVLQSKDQVKRLIADIRRVAMVADFPEYD